MLLLVFVLLLLLCCRCCFTIFVTQSYVFFIVASSFHSEIPERLFFCNFHAKEEKQKKSELFTCWMHSDWSFEVVSNLCALFLCVYVCIFYWVDKQFLFGLFLCVKRRWCAGTRSFACHFKHFIGFWNSNCIHFVNSILNACGFSIPLLHRGSTNRFDDYVKRDFNYRAHFNSSFAFFSHSIHI